MLFPTLFQAMHLRLFGQIAHISLLLLNYFFDQMVSVKMTRVFGLRFSRRKSALDLSN